MCSMQNGLWKSQTHTERHESWPFSNPSVTSCMPASVRHSWCGLHSDSTMTRTSPTSSSPMPSMRTSSSKSKMRPTGTSESESECESESESESARSSLREANDWSHCGWMEAMVMVMQWIGVASEFGRTAGVGQSLSLSMRIRIRMRGEIFRQAKFAPTDSARPSRVLSCGKPIHTYMRATCDKLTHFLTHSFTSRMNIVKN